MMEALQTANAELREQLEGAQAEAEAARHVVAQRDLAEEEAAKQVAKAHKMVIDGLIQEMRSRRRDLDALSDINQLAGGRSRATSLAPGGDDDDADTPTMQP